MTNRTTGSWATGILTIAIVAAACGGGNATATPVPTSAPTAVAATALGTTAPMATATETAMASPAATASPTPGSGLPNFSHVYVIILENKEYGSIVGSGSAPYLNALIARYGLTPLPH